MTDVYSTSFGQGKVIFRSDTYESQIEELVKKGVLIPDYAKYLKEHLDNVFKGGTK